MATAGADSLRKALRILELMTPQRASWTASEVAKSLSLPTSTAHRILQVLAESGYLVRDAQGRYGLGFAAVRLGERAQATYDVLRVVHPALEAVTARTGETSLFAVHDPVSECAVVVDFVESPEPLKVVLPITHEVPSGGSISRVHEAWLRPGVDGRPVGDEALPYGYAFAYEETQEGTWGAAVPFRDDAGNLLGVLAVLAPTARFDEDRKRSAVSTLLDVSARPQGSRANDGDRAVVVGH